jgi:serine/threonine-protein kinase Chk2
MIEKRQSHRLVVRDLGSSSGTCMLYGSMSEEAEPGFNIDFSAEGPSLLNMRPPIIKVHNRLQLKLVVPLHDITSDTYLPNVERFRKGSADAEDLFADIELLGRASTELPTPAPGGIVTDLTVSGHFMWKKEIGRGAFAAVYYVWDVQSREEYALKKPLPENHPSSGQTENRMRLKAWRREAEILKRLHHVSASFTCLVCRHCDFCWPFPLSFPTAAQHRPAQALYRPR